MVVDAEVVEVLDELVAGELTFQMDALDLCLLEVWRDRAPLWLLEGRRRTAA